MRILARLSLLIFIFFNTSALIRNDAIIQFSRQDHNIGTIPLKEEVQYGFEFFKPCKKPLVISNVKTSCGCTIPEWPRKPIMPGVKGEIKVAYDAPSPGVFHKTITVYFNGKNSPLDLKIKGKVECTGL